MKRSFFVLTLVALAFASPAFAQEDSATPAAPTSAEVTNAALQQKNSYLTQMVRLLEQRLNECRSGNGEPICPSMLPSASGAAPESTNIQSHSTSTPPPARRFTGGYQGGTDARLGCDDYSMSYFRRHPAMAAVCGINAQTPPAPEAQPASPTAPVSPTHP